MPRIDVTDALLDPDYIDELVCERIEQVIGDNGIASNAMTEVPFMGAVMSADGDELIREPSGDRVGGTITIVTKFRLIAGEEGYGADVVHWASRRWTVKGLADYSRYGRGFVGAKCELVQLSG